LTIAGNIVARARRSYRSLRRGRKPIVPVRPIVMIQSDDWGRVGIPSTDALERLKSAGADVGHSRWDYYGLESEADLASLKDVLMGIRDRDGALACITANFVMANADLARMRDEGFQHFRWIGIDRGFPEPWKENLMPAYRDLIGAGIFEPALHGFTHFNVTALMQCLQDESERGRRARLLVAHDVPYLASWTPEYNFALVTRGGRENYLNTAAQDEWVASGVRLFTDAFCTAPRATCAPGYRANAVTKQLWKKHQIEAVQSVGPGGLEANDGLIELQRNVTFEPVLEEGEVVARALDQARRAVAQGAPIVICTHSINYVTRFARGAERSRELLRKLLGSLLVLFPDLRFARAGEVIDALKSARSDWFRVSPSSLREVS
jgi:hypothetical protein